MHLVETLSRPVEPWILLLGPGWASSIDSTLEEIVHRGGLVARATATPRTRAWAVAESFADQLHFPGYYGHNWDALEECLGDTYHWLHTPTVVLVLDGADHLLTGDPDGFHRLIDVITDAADRAATPVDDEEPLNRPVVALHGLLLASPDDWMTLQAIAKNRIVAVDNAPGSRPD